MSHQYIPLTRRGFLRSSALLGGAIVAAPAILPSSVFGQNAPSKRVTLGIIGCGNQCSIDILEFLKNPECQVVAVCDVNKASFGYKTPKQFLGREPIRDLVEKHYAQDKRSGSFKGCAIYTDYRDVLARKDIDAVVIITPDHWHSIMTIDAAAAGKDIYCQKPLTLTVRDGQEMVKAVRRHNRILQTGSQYRSYAIVRRACEIVRNGYLGKIKRVETYVAENNFKGPGPGWKEAPVPEGFDYNFWLGPAPAVPYHPDRCFYKFRFILDYSGGQTTNFGAHSNDVVQWALGMDDTTPIEYSDLGSEFPPAGDLFNTPTKVAFRARYANGIELDCITHKLSFGARFEGSEGWLFVNGKKIEASSPALQKLVLKASDLRLPVSENHYKNFIDCVKSRKEPIEPVEAGHHTATLCHLGNAAMLFKRKIKWDPKKEIAVNDAEVNAFLSRPPRAPWKYGA